MQNRTWCITTIAHHSKSPSMELRELYVIGMFYDRIVLSLSFVHQDTLYSLTLAFVKDILKATMQ